jgi:hypothetical protein
MAFRAIPAAMVGDPTHGRDNSGAHDAEAPGALWCAFANKDSDPSLLDLNLLEVKLRRHGKRQRFHCSGGGKDGFSSWCSPNDRREQSEDTSLRIFAVYANGLAA